MSFRSARETTEPLRTPISRTGKTDAVINSAFLGGPLEKWFH
jgi:hypothetical protein